MGEGSSLVSESWSPDLPVELYRSFEVDDNSTFADFHS